MAYRLIIPKPVQKDIDRLPHPIQHRVNDQIQSLAEDPRPYGYIKLKGTTNQYRIRIGNYRVV